MAFTFCTSAEAVALSGAGASATVTGNSTTMDSYSDMAEGWIQQESGRDFKTNYATINTELKGALRMASAARIAFLVASFSTVGYFNSREQETILDVLDEMFTKNMNFIKDWSSASVRTAT